MNLIVDIGNTRAKYAVFEDNVCRQGGVGFPAIRQFLASLNEKDELNVILSTTGPISWQEREFLRTKSMFFCELSSEIPLPIRLGYETPKTLGCDRIAGCVGGVFLYPGRDLLIIDSGTAITFDFVTASGVFLGGNISPGINIRFKALHEYTSSLPLVQVDDNYGFVGKNTSDAILNGVMEGMLFEVRGYIDAWKEDNPNSVVIITGGGGKYLRDKLNRVAVFEEQLVMIGLNRILEYQKTVNNDRNMD